MLKYGSFEFKSAFSDSHLLNTADAKRCLKSYTLTIGRISGSICDFESMKNFLNHLCNKASEYGLSCDKGKSHSQF